MQQPEIKGIFICIYFRDKGIVVRVFNGRTGLDIYRDSHWE